jgi:hypothetical protein
MDRPTAEKTCSRRSSGRTRPADLALQPSWHPGRRGSRRLHPSGRVAVRPRVESRASARLQAARVRPRRRCGMFYGHPCADLRQPPAFRHLQRNGSRHQKPPRGPTIRASASRTRRRSSLPAPDGARRTRFSRVSRVSARGLRYPQHSQMPQLVTGGSITARARSQTVKATRADPRGRPVWRSYRRTAARADPDRSAPPTVGRRVGTLGRSSRGASARSGAGRLRGISLRRDVHGDRVGQLGCRDRGNGVNDRLIVPGKRIDRRVMPRARFSGDNAAGRAGARGSRRHRTRTLARRRA